MIKTLITAILAATLILCPISCERTEKEISIAGAVKPTEVAIEETVLVDQDGVKITAKSLEMGGFFGPEIKIKIENNSGKDLAVSVDDMVINGYMISPLSYTDISNDTIANTGITISESGLKNSGITTIADIQLRFRVSCDFEEYFTTELISLKTTAAEGFEQTYNSEGTVVYEENNIKVVCQGYVEGSLFGPELFFYIENNSDRPILVTTDGDPSINKVMISGSLFSQVLPNTRIVDSMTILTDLEENGITEVEEIKFKLSISDADSWKSIAKTDPIIISFH